MACRCAVSRVAEEARATAPRQSGALAESYRPFTRGNIAGVRSRLPYAGVVEYGGTIDPRGAPITFGRRLIVTKAAEREADRVVDEIGSSIEEIARRHGWH
jgi:phage gpG-like protein